MLRTARALTAVSLLSLLHVGLAHSAASADRDALRKQAVQALAELTRAVPAARRLAASAHAVLVFPRVTQAGLVVGGQYGEGVLLRKGRVLGFYNIVGASYGLQAGAQRYGQALFFMNAEALAYLDRSDGFELGMGPSLVVVDEVKARTMTTTTLNDDIYGFAFGQRGMMLSMALRGNKINRLAAEE